MPISRSIEPDSALVDRLAVPRSCLAVPSSGLVSRLVTLGSGLVAMPFFHSPQRSTVLTYSGALLQSSVNHEASGHLFEGFHSLIVRVRAPFRLPLLTVPRRCPQ